MLNKQNIKLREGDLIQVIAPSGNLKLDSSVFKIAKDNFEKSFGIKIEYSKNSGKPDKYGSSSLEKRLDDLHNAFSNKKVKGIICLSGGYNSNDLLKYINWKIIKNNPKPIIGSSDITVLINSIYSKTGLISFLGPNYFKFGMKIGLDYTVEYFKKCLISNTDYLINSSKEWSSDKWYRDQDNRCFYKNRGMIVVNEGKAKGVIIGGNLCSLNLLQGTEFMPSLKNSILIIEDDDLAGEDSFGEFGRNFQSLLHLPDAKYIKGIIFGRFQPNSKMDIKKIKYSISSKKELKNIPVIVNADFGHTDPMLTLPIGGTLEMIAKKGNPSVKIINN